MNSILRDKRLINPMLIRGRSMILSYLIMVSLIVPSLSALWYSDLTCCIGSFEIEGNGFLLFFLQLHEILPMVFLFSLIIFPKFFFLFFHFFLFLFFLSLVLHFFFLFGFC